MANLEQWSSNANEAIHIALIRPSAQNIDTVDTFNPAFTYPIFGEEETIFGYKDLRIDLSFSAHNVRPNLDITFSEKFQPVGETEATNIEESLKAFLPPSAFEDPATFKSNLLADKSAADFQPPGTLLNSYSVKGRNFEIWTASLTDLAAKEQLPGMQILVPFYIEGGTIINLEDPDWTVERWKIFVIYEVLSSPPSPHASKYSFIGYSTAYRIYLFIPPTPPTTPPAPTSDAEIPFPPAKENPITSFPCRERISQFLILPPYRGFSHGRHLYNTMFTFFLSDPTCHEITVEDPNEAFDDLRDYCDIQRLLHSPALSPIRINTSVSLRNKPRLPTSEMVDTALLENIRREQKIAPRQFARLVDMYLLSLIPPMHRNRARLARKEQSQNEYDRMYYLWRLLVKQRLYKHNRDQLAQLDLQERKEKLEETLVGVEADYVRLLRGAEEGMKEEEVEREREVEGGRPETRNGANGANGMKKGRALKRVIEDDENEEMSGMATPTKKVKASYES